MFLGIVWKLKKKVFGIFTVYGILDFDFSVRVWEILIVFFYSEFI